jgi:hypothetical protein
MLCMSGVMVLDVVYTLTRLWLWMEGVIRSG